MYSAINNKTPLLKSIKMFGNELVEVVYNDNVDVTVKELDQAYKLYDEVTGTNKVLKLLIIGKGTRITVQARQHIINENIKRNPFIIAEAIVVNSVAQKVSCNIYIRFISKIYPTRFFTDVEDASEWLLHQAKIVSR